MSFMQKGTLVSWRGNIYQESRTKGMYRRLELYLPSSTGTYNEPLEDTFYRLADRIMAGTLKPSYADGNNYVIDGDKVKLWRKEKAPS